MQIIVNHVTRMRAPRICVAGIDERTRRHIRPITPRSDPLTRELLRSQGGPFGPGAVVDIGALAAQGRPPEVEDHRFAASQARHVEDLADDAYLTALGKVARGSVVEAFGPALREVRPRKLAVPAGRGECSLAVVEVRCPRLHIDGWGKLRLDLDDGHVSARLPVTDARFYGARMRSTAGWSATSAAGWPAGSGPTRCSAWRVRLVTLKPAACIGCSATGSASPTAPSATSRELQDGGWPDVRTQIRWADAAAG